MSYKLIKRVIERGGYDADDLRAKLDAYLAFGRITVAQYNELMGLVTADTEGNS